MVRSVVAVLLGLFSGVVIMLAFEYASHAAFPAPDNLAQLSAEQLAHYVQQLPLSAFLLVLAGWFFAAVDGSIMAGWLAPNRPVLHAAIVCTVFLLMAMLNLIWMPHPFWMVITTPFIYIAAFLIGSSLAKRLHTTRHKS